MRRHVVLLFVLTQLVTLTIHAQELTVYDMADPAVARSRVGVTVESYFFRTGPTFYKVMPSYYYALPNHRHLFSLAVPFVHNVFMEDLGGFENTTGLGDVQMSYLTVPVLKDDPLGFNRLSIYGTLSAPTGEYLVGRGAGTWLFKPGMIFRLQAAPEVCFYPQIAFQISASETNSLGGGQNLPDPSNLVPHRKLQNILFQWPAVVVISAADSWFGINPEYIYSFDERTAYVFFEVSVGKMLNPTTSGTVRISRFVAGQPTLIALVGVDFNFFLR